MKKSYILLLAAVGLGLAGCSKEVLDAPEPVNTYKVILTGDTGTKTSFGTEADGALNVLWKAGDMIGLYVSEDGTALTDAQNILSRVVTVIGSGPGYSRGTFATDLPLKESSRYDFAIYYPYTDSAGSSSQINHTIPSVQTQPSADYSGHLGMAGCFAYTTAGFDTPESLEMYPSPAVGFTLDYKTSVIWLKVTAASADMAGWKVKSVSVTAPEGCALAGDVTYVPADDSFVISGNGSERVSLNIPGGAALSTDSAIDLYMVTYPAELAGKSLEIRYVLESSDATESKVLVHSKSFDAGSASLARGRVHRITESVPASGTDGWTTEEVVDLSAGGTANCYIVSTPGKYSFDATVIGNGQKGILTPSSTTFFHTENASITPASVQLLWQTAQGLITELSLTDGRITFTKSDEQYGNALIAAKDADGNVLWSWHIWCTDMGRSQTYVSDYGTYEGMDRNLGATYAASEVLTDQALLTRSMGLFYVWGRKDPFNGPEYFAWSSTAYSIPMAPLYDIDGNTFTRPDYVIARETSGGSTSTTSGTGSSVAWSVKNPTTFVAVDGNTSNDWFSSGKLHKGSGPEYRAYSLWGNPKGYEYASDSKPTPVKTIYDPCPVGYMVPPPDFYDALSDKGGNEYGKLLSPDGGTTLTWYPSASLLASNNDSVKNGNWACVNKVGYYRTSAFTSSSATLTYTMMAWANGSDSKGTVYQYDNRWHNSYGFSLRCVQELK